MDTVSDFKMFAGNFNQIQPLPSVSGLKPHPYVCELWMLNLEVELSPEDIHLFPNWLDVESQ